MYFIIYTPLKEAMYIYTPVMNSMFRRQLIYEGRYLWSDFFQIFHIYRFYLKEWNVKFSENKKNSAAPPPKKINFAHILNNVENNPTSTFNTLIFFYFHFPNYTRSSDISLNYVFSVLLHLNICIGSVYLVWFINMLIISFVNIVLQASFKNLNEFLKI